MLTVLRNLLAGLGSLAVMIALAMWLLGPGPTAAPGFAIFDALAGRALPRPIWMADADSELRFYAAIWLGFGVLAIRASKNPAADEALTPWLALIFFLGRLGRLWSLASVGPPHPFFTVLMSVELALPPVLALLWLAVTRRSGATPAPADRRVD